MLCLHSVSPQAPLKHSPHTHTHVQTHARTLFDLLSTEDDGMKYERRGRVFFYEMLCKDWRASRDEVISTGQETPPTPSHVQLLSSAGTNDSVVVVGFLWGHNSNQRLSKGIQVLDVGDAQCRLYTDNMFFLLFTEPLWRNMSAFAALNKDGEKLMLQGECKRVNQHLLTLVSSPSQTRPQCARFRHVAHTDRLTHMQSDTHVCGYFKHVHDV